MGSTLGCGEEKLCSEKCRIVDCKPTEKVTVIEPAGAVFTETLTGLNEVDRELLLFSGRGHLSAVCWLLKLGANVSATDSNGTSGPHAACRKGNLKVVQFFLQSNSFVGCTDCAGWTPLHVAAFMGQRHVCQELLAAAAEATLPSNTGQSPLELCTDTSTRQLIVLHSGDARPSAPMLPHSAAPVVAPVSSEDCLQEDSKGEGEKPEIRYEPFFIPRKAVFGDCEREARLDALCDRLSQKFFEQHGGRALAFMVASGVVRDFPVDLIIYLRAHECSPREIGWFLSEDFSLAKILRMEFFNSVRLLDTGVLSALCFALLGLRLPLDLQRLDRCMWSLAECWWRQHIRARRDGVLNTFKGSGEISGKHLAELIGSVEDLHELFFSTVILHWNLHAPLPQSQRLTASDWIEMHRVGGVQIVREEVLSPIYEVLAKAPLDPLLLGPSPGDERVEGPAARSLCGSEATLEGWASVQGDGLQMGLEDPLQLPLHNGLEENISSLCEGTFSGRRPKRPSHAVQVLAAPTPRREAAWLTFCNDSLLLLSLGPAHCPFAFLKLKEVKLADVDPGRALLSLNGSSERGRVELVLLLPDGRWHTCSMHALVIQVLDVSQLKNWVLSFAPAAGASKSLLQI